MNPALSALLSSLVRVMGEQRDRFRDSLALTLAQREAILGKKDADLERLTREEGALGDTLKHLEEERKGIWRKAAATLGRPEAEMTWEQVAAGMPEAESQAFSKLLDEMNELLRQLVSENASNLHLLRHGIDMHTVTVQAAIEAGGVSYGPTGVKDGGGGSAGPPPTKLDRTA